MIIHSLYTKLADPVHFIVLTNVLTLYDSNFVKFVIKYSVYGVQNVSWLFLCPE